MTDEIRRAETRVALVIGNGGYLHERRLDNPVNDAQAIAKCLGKLGFSKIAYHEDVGADALKRAVVAFRRTADEADTAVIYFAGHGIETGGVNFLLAVDAQLEDIRDVEHEAVSLDQLLNAVEGARRLRLVILDACRDSGFRDRAVRLTRTRSVGAAGLADVNLDRGNLVVAYAAKGGTKALDGDGPHSPYAEALLEHLAKPLDIRRLFGFVRDAVWEKTGGVQTPHLYESLGGAEVFLVPGAKPADTAGRDAIDVFISYSREDWPLARLLVHRLRTEGYGVWWDNDLTAGLEFDRETLDALAAARTAIVIWTKTSVDSNWVRGEARRALDQKIDAEGKISKLIPLRAKDLEIDRIRPPFDALHTLPLEEHPRLRSALQRRGVSPRVRAKGHDSAGAVERRDTLDPGDFESFLEQFPNGSNATLAERQIERLIAEETVSEVLDRFIREHCDSPRISLAKSRLAALADPSRPDAKPRRQRKRRGAKPPAAGPDEVLSHSPLHAPVAETEGRLPEPIADAADALPDTGSTSDPSPAATSADVELESAVDSQADIPAVELPIAEMTSTPEKPSIENEHLKEYLAHDPEAVGRPAETLATDGHESVSAISVHEQTDQFEHSAPIPDGIVDAASVPEHPAMPGVTGHAAPPVAGSQEDGTSEKKPIEPPPGDLEHDQSFRDQAEFDVGSSAGKIPSEHGVGAGPPLEEESAPKSDPELLRPIDIGHDSTSVAATGSGSEDRPPPPTPTLEFLSIVLKQAEDASAGIHERSATPAPISARAEPQLLTVHGDAAAQPQPFEARSRPPPSGSRAPLRRRDGSRTYARVIAAVALAAVVAAFGMWYLSDDEARCSLGVTQDAAARIAACEAAVRRDPQRGELRFTLGALRFREGDFRRAIADFDAAVGSRFTAAELYDYRSRAREALNEYDEALNDYDIAVRDPKYRRALAPKYADALIRRGNQRLNSGALSDAISDFTRAIDLDANNVAAYEGRRLAYEKADNFDAALKDFTREVELQPARASTRLNPKYAGAYIKRGISRTKEPKLDYAKAIDDFSAALRIDPGTPFQQFDVYNYRRMARESLSDFRRAAEDYDVMLKLNRPKAESLPLRAEYLLLYRTRADALAAKKEFKQAVDEYSIALRANPRDTASYVGRGNANLELRQWDAAIADFDAVIAIDPASVAAHRNLGRARLNKNENEEAIKSFTQALTLDKRDLDSFKGRRAAYEALSNFEAALDDYTEAVKLSPQYADAAPLDAKYAEALRTRARSFAYFGRAFLESIVTNEQPPDLTPRTEVCRERARTGDQAPDSKKLATACYELALRDYDQVLKLSPDNYRALNARCWVRGITWKPDQLKPALDDCRRAEQVLKTALGAAKGNAQLTMQLNATYHSTLDSRGLVYLKTKQYDAAIDDYDTVVDYLKPSPDPEDKVTRAQALYGRGLAKRRGRASGGEDDITEAKSLRPTIVEMFKLYGVGALPDHLATAPSAKAAFERLPNVAFRWSGQEAYSVGSVQECEIRCSTDGTCQGFTYFKQKNLCRLMDTLTERLADPTADSGVKGQLSAR